ncbi:diguanylate cyclase [Syntrophomonas curvata]
MGHSEGFYHFIVDRMINAFAYSRIITDETGNAIDYELLEVNPAFEELTGYKSSEIVNCSFSLLFPDQRDFISTWVNRLQKVCQNGGREAFEYYWAPLRRWFYITAYNVETHHFITIFSDISCLKKTESAIREERRNFSTFFDSIDAFVFVLDTNGCIKYVNRTVLDGLGYSREELKNTHVWLLYPREQHKEFRRIFSAMIRGREKYCTIPLQHKNGAQIPVESRIVKGIWSGEEVFFAVSKDISDLMLSEQKFSHAFHFNPTLMSISSLEDGYYFDVNESYCRKFEYTRDELIGHSSLELGILLDAGQRDRAKQIITAEGKLVNYEIILRTKTGKELIGLCSVKCIRIGSKDYLLTMINDITEIRAMQKAMEEKNRQLEKLNRMLVTQAVTDDLTGLYNHRYIFASLEKEMGRAERYRQPLTIIMLDLDHFKEVNDRFGHPAGDKVLATVAAIIRSSLRETDIAGRFGGDEFMIILPHTGVAEGQIVAERIRYEIEQCPFTSQNIRITMSIGVCEYAGEELDQLVTQVDELLYLAKNKGRNRTEANVPRCKLGTLYRQDF